MDAPTTPPIPTPSERRRRRRGAALILVILFLLTITTLVSMLLQMTTVNVRAEHDSHRLKALQQVVRAGLATSLNEINRRRLEGASAPDPDGLGWGACLRPGSSGALDGVPVRTNGSTGTIIGYFKADVREETISSVKYQIIRVVAANDFTLPAGRIVATGAEFAVKRGRPPFPANPLSLTGDLTAGRPGGYDYMQIKGSAQVNINDGTYEVPAINITAADVYNDAIGSSFAGKADSITGADPDSPGNPASGSNTITNADAGVLSNATVNNIAANIDTYVANNLATATNFNTAVTTAGGTISSDKMTGNVTLPNDPDAVYLLTSLDEIKGKITGTGTLIIRDDVEIMNGGELVWNGNIIVQGETTRTDFIVDGDCTVNGILCIQSKDPASMGIGDANLILGHGGGAEGTLNVNGSLLVIADNHSDLELPSGSGLNVNGAFVLMGQDLRLDTAGGSKINITGTAAINVPDGATTGLDKVQLDGGKATFTWDRGQFESGMDLLGEFFDPNDQILPLRHVGYWESNTVLSAQTTRLGGTMPALPTGWGFQN